MLAGNTAPGEKVQLAASQDGATCLQSYIITYAASKKKKSLCAITPLFSRAIGVDLAGKKKYEAHLEQFAPPQTSSRCVSSARPPAR